MSTDNVLEFPELPHRTRDRTSSPFDSGDLKVGNEFSSKDSFLGALKQYSINYGVNYNVVKSKSEKFEAKCLIRSSQDRFRHDSYLNTTDVECGS
ncbi:hypothetical protein PVK06_034638 [Gossypium arboreum]|uniref:Uncharacterized protein n=1 Tax=Gossypium arboreum TaxID=29729 RepID=A0ABR0NGV9_GOSAR|nr:hypothetical protein PVK06_034638 [Gossypium arboreum]